MPKLSVVFRFATPGYIEQPYWPEMYHMIEIQKKSGINRAKSDAGRDKALKAYLEKIQMTPEQYAQLEKDAHRPFHMDDGKIIIPADKVLSCLVNGAYVAPAAVRPVKAEQLRSEFKATTFFTDRTAPDGVWERFARPSKSGQQLSNQRSLRSSPFIRDFEATGSLEWANESLKQDAVLRFLQYVGREVGIGASRKMGWGRFSVELVK